MIDKFKTAIQTGARKLGLDIVRYRGPVEEFHSDTYLRHNARRLEHLASLRIPVAGMSVLEVGAGIGDHSHYYLDRGCRLTITEARSENLQYLRDRYASCDVRSLDMERPAPVAESRFDIVHCYGLLYHLSDPQRALEFLSESAGKLLFLETCVSFGDGEEIHLTAESREIPSQAVSGTGCRPTRPWLFNRLRDLFEYVYLPTTQPNHEQFPIDWAKPERTETQQLARAVFIASRDPLDNEALTPSLIDRQTRQL